jgi:hypothetical protein
MKTVVIEICDTRRYVTIHANESRALDHAVNIAAPNCDASRQTIRQTLAKDALYAEGAYEVSLHEPVVTQGDKSPAEAVEELKAEIKRQRKLGRQKDDKFEHRDADWNLAYAQGIRFALRELGLIPKGQRIA